MTPKNELYAGHLSVTGSDIFVCVSYKDNNKKKEIK